MSTAIYKCLVFPNLARPLKILLVEDHLDTMEALSRLLKKWGCAVLPAGNMRIALQKGRDENFDLMLSDLGLPDGDGWELARTLCREKHCPAVAMSGLGTDQDLRKSIESGFTLHIVKPFDPDDLYEVLQSIGSKINAD